MHLDIFFDRRKGRLILAYETIILLSSCMLHKSDGTIVISDLIKKEPKEVYTLCFMFICTSLKSSLYYINHINYSSIFIFKFDLLPEEGEIEDEGWTLVSLCCIVFDILKESETSDQHLPYVPKNIHDSMVEINKNMSMLNLP